MWRQLASHCCTARLKRSTLRFANDFLNELLGAFVRLEIEGLPASVNLVHHLRKVLQ